MLLYQILASTIHGRIKNITFSLTYNKSLHLASLTKNVSSSFTSISQRDHPDLESSHFLDSSYMVVFFQTMQKV